jgi:hypothetical protein
MAQTLETWTADRLDELENSKRLKRLLKKNILARHDDGKIYQYKMPDATRLEIFAAKIKEKNPTAVILNLLSESEALSVYSKQA